MLVHIRVAQGRSEPLKEQFYRGYCFFGKLRQTDLSATLKLETRLLAPTLERTCVRLSHDVYVMENTTHGRC